jgi:multiple sugar transport system permease protein
VIAASGAMDAAAVPRRRRRGSFERGLVLPAFVFVVAVSFVPFGYALVQSLYRSEFLDLGRFVGFGNYVEFLTDRPGMGKTLIFVGGSLAVAVPLGVLLALLLNEITRGREVIRTILIVPWLLSGVVTGRIWAWLLNGDLGPIAHLLQGISVRMPNAATSPVLAMPAVIVAHAWSAYPLVMVLTLAALQTIPRDVLEAARMDGAVGLRRFRFIVFPLIRSTVLVLIVLTSIHAFNHVTLIFVMTGGGPVGTTEVMALRVFMEGFRFYHLGLASAGAVIMFLLNVAFTVGYVRVLRPERA